MDVPTYHKVLFVTDGAINIAPTLEDKVDICQNAIDLIVALGIKKPKVAVLAAVETVTRARCRRPSMPRVFCKMAEWLNGMDALLDGPLAFDNAISKQWAEEKAINLLSLVTRISFWRRISKPRTFWPSN